MAVHGITDGRVRRRALAVAIGAAAALPVLGAVPAGAAQDTPPDPQTTNIPYLAWRGEQVRLVKCDPSLANATRLETFVESWSGSGPLPRVEDQSTSTFFNAGDLRCARVDVTTLDAGLARIKLVASDDSGTPLLKHQFLAAWMNLTTPTIDEVGANDPTGFGPPAKPWLPHSDSEVGDPAGDGHFLAGARDGRVQATVKGTFPYAGGTVTLPDGWADLANTLATDNNPATDGAADAMRWDIHDDLTKAEGHNDQYGFCKTLLAPPFAKITDAVDNCNGGIAFSRFVNGHVDEATGPFDPQRPDSSLLPDGKLDAGDAPMPAARIDFRIAPNSGKAGDVSGAGALESASKLKVYSRNGNGDPSPHNLYAPFYKQYIPATSAPDPRASGVDGPAAGNNFDGFLVDGMYWNWDTIPLKTLAPTDTHCNQFVQFPTDLRSQDMSFRHNKWDDVPRTTPEGDQTVAVYTDEHGEAQVKYEPYAGGFYFDSVGAIRNDNRGCDLQGVDVLGTASITATVKYPYQPVDDPSKTSAAVTKTVHNQFDKSLSYYAKGAGAENANARIVVAHGNDIDGTPMAGERVCFYVGNLADGARVFQGETGPADGRFVVSGDSQVWLRDYVGADQCVRLDAHGNGAIEVFNSDPEKVNVIAEYVDEGLLRSIDVDFGTAGSSGGTPPTPDAHGPSSGEGTSAPSAAQVAATAPGKVELLGNVSSSKGSKAAKKTRVRSVKIVRSHGRYYLRVRVDSSKSKVRIAIQLLNKKHRKLGRVHNAIISANKTIRVMRVPKAARSARVTLR